MGPVVRGGGGRGQGGDEEEGEDPDGGEADAMRQVLPREASRAGGMNLPGVRPPAGSISGSIAGGEPSYPRSSRLSPQARNVSSLTPPESPQAVLHLKAKVCLVGESAVGKTSLIRRFVLDQFEGAYVMTLGVKVSRKQVLVTSPERVEADLMIWDIMGSRGFRDLLQDAYFNGARGILAVCDSTRPDTLRELDSWLSAVFQKTGPLPVRVLANKADLAEQRAVTEGDLRALAEKYRAPSLFTSAKTGENVEAAFRGLSAAIVEAGRETLRQ